MNKIDQENNRILQIILSSLTILFTLVSTIIYSKEPSLTISFILILTSIQLGLNIFDNHE